MPVVAVINRKGGSGKSTLATHLAAYCAHQGLPVLLGDTDRNRSSQLWLDLRQQQHGLPRAHRMGAITGRVVDLRNVLRAPPGTSHVVLDTPGGLHGFDLARVVCHADAVLLPVCPSVFDRDAAAACWAELKALPRVASGRCRVAAVGMRVDARTKALRLLKAWAQAQELPFIGSLRDAQTYVHCTESGLSMFDLPPLRVAADLAEWAPVIDWLRPVLHPQPLPAAAPLAHSVRPCFQPDPTRETPAAPVPAPATATMASSAAFPAAPAAARSFFERTPGRLPGITIPGALDALPPQARPPAAASHSATSSTPLLPGARRPVANWARRLDKVLDSVSFSRWLPRSS